MSKLDPSPSITRRAIGWVDAAEEQRNEVFPSGRDRLSIKWGAVSEIAVHSNYLSEQKIQWKWMQMCMQIHIYERKKSMKPKPTHGEI